VGNSNFGIGVDIENVDRFEKFISTGNNSFLNKIFTQSEIEYCFSNGKIAPHLAARYAGKEAIVKALTSIGKTKVDYREIEIANNGNGVPMARINNEEFDNFQIHLSLSHCKDKAIAFAVVMEKN